ncbi:MULTISPECIES: TetR/AcrR family transcriptional regulator [Methylosinus]|nr:MULTISPECIES: helix-turn-helix domain-containing protein [Methylosinus]OBS52272.1 TetR family transcriptional regulator [Methylosinus sp. 3S-1]
MNIPRRRPYRQTARAAASQDMAQAILRAFRNLLHERWYDEISLDDVAAKAKTTRQTVIRRFGGKTGLLSAFTTSISGEIEAKRSIAPTGDIRDAVAVLVADYERNGAMVLRFLALEGRLEEVEPMLETGRRGHRRWVESTFGARLDAFGEAERRDRLAQLLIATDVWSWLLLRRTQGHDVPETERLLTAMISKLLV